MDVIAKIENISRELDELQTYLGSLALELSEADERLSDLYHYVENNKISAFESYRLFKEMKEVLVKRREIKRNMEFNRVIMNNQGKLLTIENRKFLINDLYKASNKMKYPYKNRVYEEDEIEKIVRGTNDEEQGENDESNNKES